MQQITERMNKSDIERKAYLVSLLIEQGYGTYARRLQEFDLVCADVYHGHYIDVAAMFPETGEIVVNPGMFSEGESQRTKDQLSLVIRHELLHFLLVHEKRLYDYLKAHHKDFEQKLRNPTVRDLANKAEDWDLSREGYNKHDQQVAHNLSICGRVVGGLVLEMDKPEWMNKTLEEMYDLLMKEHEENMKKNPPKKPKIKIKKATHTPEYINAYNEIMRTYDDPKYTDGDLANILADIMAEKAD